MQLPRFTQSLRFRLLVGCLAIEIITVCLLIGNSLRLIDQYQIEQTERRITAIELAYKTAIGLPMVRQDYATLDDILEQWRQTEDIAYLAITDRQGKIIASSGWPAEQALPRPGNSLADKTRHVSFAVDVSGQHFGDVHYGLSLDFLDAARNKLLLQGLLIALLEIGLSAVVLFGMVHWLTRHLARLTEASNRIADGEYSIELRPAQNDEAGQLTGNFNQIAKAASNQLTQPSTHLSENRTLLEALELTRNFNRMAEAVSTQVTQLATHLSENRTLLEALGEGVYGLDRNGLCTFINPAGLAMLGYRAEELVGQPLHQIIHHSHADGRPFPHTDCPVYKTSQDGQRRNLERDCLWRKDGSSFPAATSVTPLITEGQLRGAVVAFRDISERVETENQLYKLSQAVEQSPENIIITDLEGRIEYVNAAFISNTGYSSAEAIGKTPRLLKSPLTPAATFTEMWATLHRGEVWRGEFISQRKDGSQYFESAIIAPVRNSAGKIEHYLALKQDISKQKANEEEIHRLANFDALTGLLNRNALLERLDLALALAQRRATQNALLLFNIDRFKNLNDARGHALGDLLLVALGGRLSGLLRDGDALARLAADEFAILLQDLGSDRESASHSLMVIANKIHAMLELPFVLDGEDTIITASVGITLLPENADDTAEECLRRANTALHRAKAAGGRQHAFFEETMGASAQQRFQIERELRRGIIANELRLYLQPQVNAQGVVIGAEALVRWQHPTRGLLPPGVFIPVAEESSLIIELENWVISETCRLMAQEEMAGRPLHVAVNVSPRHFRDANFETWLLDRLAQHGNDPGYLTLEITEGMVVDNFAAVIARMDRLSARGIHFSIDDFGTGYSSLAYLKRLPIHELKIDKTFVQDAPHDPDDAALVDTILAIAAHMHLKVVAEGVETAEQAAFLNSRNAQIIHQGYLYGRPVPAAEWLAQRLPQQIATS